MGGRDTQPHRPVVAQRLLHSLRLMRRQVVGDQVNLLTGRLMCRDLAQKRHELLRGVTRRGLAGHLTGLRVETPRKTPACRAGSTRPHAVRPVRRQRRHRVVAIERLS